MAPLSLPANIKRYAEMAGSGLIKEFLPSIAKGLILEMFAARRITVKEVFTLVQQDKDLWGFVGAADRTSVRTYAGKFGRMNWMTADWLIDALRDEQPAIASIFLSDDQAKAWLEKQVANLKREAAL